MSKFIIGRTLTISIENYSYGCSYIQMDTPMSYSLYDLIQMIKMWTNYTDTYDWIFSNPYKDSGVKNLSLENDREEIENTAFHKFRKSTPTIICNYGPIEIELGARGFLKYRKVYPTIYQAVGYFPTEEEFLNNIKSNDIDGKYTTPRKTLPSAEHLINDDLIQYEERLKEYFKNKYKISNDIVEGSNLNENKLIKK